VLQPKPIGRGKDPESHAGKQSYDMTMDGV